VALGLSTLDLDSQGLTGGRQRDMTAGLNRYLNPSTRLIFNCVHEHVHNRGNAPTVAGGRAQIWQARVQLVF